MSQSLCSPWTHDFRDCGCFYWASNHPDIAQPVLPAGDAAGTGLECGRAVGASRSDDRADAAGEGDRSLSHGGRVAPLRDQQSLAGTALRCRPAGDRRAILADPRQGRPFASLDELRQNLNYAAGVEIAVLQEYLAAAFSLKPDDDPSLRGNADLLGDVKAAHSELMRIAIGEMRHTRAVNDVMRGLSDPGAYEPALRVATQVPHTNPGPFRPVMARAATRQAVDDFIQIEAQSTGVDGLYNNILATLQFPPADVKPFVTDEWKQAIRSIIAEGEDHFETFLDIKEWLSSHQESGLLAIPDASASRRRDAGGRRLQAAYVALLNDLFVGYKKGRFLGATEINAARASMVGADGIVAKAEAVASQDFLVVFATPADARFAPINPPGSLVA